MATTVGFIGANGLMGHGMAKNIAKAGFDLVYTVHRNAPADLEAMGARRVTSNADWGPSARSSSSASRPPRTYSRSSPGRTGCSPARARAW